MPKKTSRARKTSARAPASKADNKAALRERAAKILERLRKAYPNARCELNFSNPLELAIAAILSAQCTDKRVNEVTPALFRKYRTARDWASVPQHVLEKEIRPTGFYRNKAKAIRALCAELDKSYGGQIPEDFDALVKLPGIGRKTANLIMASAFNKPGIIVDTHFRRLAQRLGFSKTDDPEEIEMLMREIIPEKDWSTWSHCIVFHGRYCCFARKPNCEGCPINDLCPSFGKIK